MTDWHETPGSSHISHVAHNPETGDFHVRFRKGGEYVYQGVADHHLDRIKASADPGGYFRTQIKGRHGFRRVG